ncbi:Microtubule-associated protein RP/EB family member 1C [Hondaea fermentalgiana]|uniref:Microtubule-associated protein RP/EB family member 1C n=1 Tax=Hondaea fermentalgiana TaxID=2315210 RepID=A0A2R5G409_9STRA|nr:Microtubule-associated protein RP/EB family member 1C [Hondaea fermentalgiana]|eukprot:GBG25730.1 Microtubule-associated protein RP/EB family member 1C [Hondaea fermentalgiana]
MATDRAVGMMNEAYFVGRREILEWLNGLCQLNLGKVEETANGAVVCQVMDALFPGTVPMKKVNWGARSDHEFVANYKVMQAVFDKVGITRHIPVDRLIRAKYQDNLEHLQWVRSVFLDHEANIPEDYDAITRRNLGKGVSLYKPAQSVAKPAARKPASRPAPRPTKTVGSAALKPKEKEKENLSRPNRSLGSSSTSSAARSPVRRAEDSKEAEKIDELEQQVKDLRASSATLQMNLESAEKERDFYFHKLREVEVLLQAYQGPDRDTVLQVLTVLYATEDDPDGAAAQAAAEAVLASVDEDEFGAEAPHEALDAAESKEGGVVDDEAAHDRDLSSEAAPVSASSYAEEY